MNTQEKLGFIGVNIIYIIRSPESEAQGELL